jgi:hypothetical protein
MKCDWIPHDSLETEYILFRIVRDESDKNEEITFRKIGDYHGRSYYPK